MKKIMLIGERRSGKSSLIRSLSDADYAPRRVLALDFFQNFVNTPSEFLENRRFYPALITAAADCGVLLFLQHAARATSQLPPAFASMFNRRVIGLVTGINAPGADTSRARKFLRNAGVREILLVDPDSGAGMDELRAALAG